MTVFPLLSTLSILLVTFKYVNNKLTKCRRFTKYSCVVFADRASQVENRDTSINETKMLTPIIFGDSLSDIHISRVPEAQPYAANIRRDRYSLDGRLWVDYLPSSSFNYATGGRHTDDLSRQIGQYQAVSRDRAQDVVFFNIGINDVGHGVPVNQSIANIDRAITQVQGLGVKNVVLMGLNSPVFNVVEFNTGLKNLSKQRSATYIDTAFVLKGLPNSGTWDNVHFTPEANRRIGIVARIVFEAMRLPVSVRQRIADVWRKIGR